MSRFISGEWCGRKYIVEPAGWRNWIRVGSFALPYFVGDRVKWTITINKKSANGNYLRGFPIYQVIPPYKKSPIMSHQSLTDDAIEFTFEKERRLSSSGEAQYWLGEPGGQSSVLLISVDVIADDKVYLIAISAIIGAVVGFLFSLIAQL